MSVCPVITEKTGPVYLIYMQYRKILYCSSRCICVRLMSESRKGENEGSLQPVHRYWEKDVRITGRKRRWQL